MTLLWLTDLHLNFLNPDELEAFHLTLRDANPDAVLLGGDIAEAPTVAQHLRRLTTLLPCPIYFVLGNHDFYRGSIAQVRTHIRAVCGRHPNLHWLPDSGVVSLTPSTALIGHDGWADARFGDYWINPGLLNDYHLIRELSHLDDATRLGAIRSLADEAATSLRANLAKAITTHRRIFVLTHVPPFREACWHQGRISDDQWLPHFSCQVAGEALVDLLRANRAPKVTVLCGHTHSSGRASILPNLEVLTGAAEYGSPAIQKIFELA